jgi:hypothetical protein
VSEQKELVALTDDERQALTDPRSEFTAEDRVFFALTYILAGENAALAAKRIGKIYERDMDGATLRKWKSRPWWPRAVESAKGYLQTKLDGRYTYLIHLTEKKMVDRILNGDTKLVTTKDAEGNTFAEKVKVPVSLRDLVGAHMSVAEQRARIRGTGQKDVAATGLDLAMKLAEMLQQQGEKKIAEAIPGEYKEVPDDDQTDPADSSHLGPLDEESAAP